ncbi:hypothetical protein D3P09_25100 [Paenibacillus pinisoli]|uniref:Nucleotidyltransferase domain-containing protein n=1 Tax=Paenibacillus pinisoli TaxID=1276110 RepID=A0A3A6P8W7_9BACL|nr:hypothetical protein [Paenibacillus pinisoli]RJX37182.1 hypothetical protein D3P09_25100 [Paenibacillus pinisoli]
MKVKDARRAAAEWVQIHVASEEWFRGAYYSGSTIAMAEDAVLPASSDIDIVVVTAEDVPPVKPGKLVFQDTLIEVTLLPWNQLASAEEVLASYHLAGSFRRDTIISDPSGHLRKLLAEAGPRFNELEWVRRRCGNARDRIESGLRGLDVHAPLHDRLTGWLFPTGVTTHVLLVAALRNPTIRLRYAAARDVLEEYGLHAVYPQLLSLLGSSHLPASRVEQHLNELARTFDAAAEVVQTPFFFRSDITALSRPIAIDGSRDLINAGMHHEAVFWIAATFARCHQIFAADAPHLQQQYLPSLLALTDDLGVTDSSAMAGRAEAVLQFMPELWGAAERILQMNPDIQQKP